MTLLGSAILDSEIPFLAVTGAGFGSSEHCMSAHLNRTPGVSEPAVRRCLLHADYHEQREAMLAHLTAVGLCTDHEVITLTGLNSTPVDDAAAAHLEDVAG